MLPPGPQPWPIVGNIYSIKPLLHRCFSEWSQAYGPIISVWIGSSLGVILSNPELAEEVLKENDHQFADRYRNKGLARVTKDGNDLTWADYGPHYVKLRKVCTLELFSTKSIKVLSFIREDEVTNMVESIFRDCTEPSSYGKGLLLRNYLREVAFNTITRMVFGKQFASLEGEMDEKLQEFKAIMRDEPGLGASFGILEHIPWLSWLFWLKQDDLDKHLARRDRLAKAIIDEHALAGKKSGVAKQHFVDVLLSLQEKYELSEDTIRGLLLDMISAGSDTSAIAVEWAMAELIKNPNVQYKAHEELERVIGSDRVMIESDLSNLPYLQCVAKEALRLHPPTPLMLPHKANADVKIGGYNIPKGSSVHVNVWAIGRDPAIWPDPLEFRPERFIEEDVDMKGHDFRLLPFGAGRRACPGAQLGINLVTSMLGHLLHHFKWTLPQGEKPEAIDMLEKPGLVAYMRTPLQAVPTMRLPSHLYKSVAVDMFGRWMSLVSDPQFLVILVEEASVLWCLSNLLSEL
ncbi:hypothetical protein F0562_024905 [Nyssa sinensis]|uniref:Cytochrome P450 n=1 Tax=Nyssa sinensis TaxID=561372 RepID=A0A5J5BGU0_9ASTE|nr:hypothetical protein F0562_024905 [Nyssa sinensis]